MLISSWIYCNDFHYNVNGINNRELVIALKLDCNREQFNSWIFDSYVKLMRLYTSEMDRMKCMGLTRRYPSGRYHLSSRSSASRSFMCASDTYAWAILLSILAVRGHFSCTLRA